MDLLRSSSSCAEISMSTTDLRLCPLLTQQLICCEEHRRSNKKKESFTCTK
ncbi:hypothetical protein DPMN_093380 [Dreissena polymorpha]|uniref:Uncharacterized protein n=1 Tax=Dreissena polymorpha TaxID=45954 RepID=A0A9D4R0Y6_DREPO|nr:hypothetical protein DPMN_093380 [Dreissena polymorpha]